MKADKDPQLKEWLSQMEEPTVNIDFTDKVMQGIETSASSISVSKKLFQPSFWAILGLFILLLVAAYFTNDNLAQEVTPPWKDNVEQFRDSLQRFQLPQIPLFVWLSSLTLLSVLLIDQWSNRIKIKA